jgi:hypothetical protein
MPASRINPATVFSEQATPLAFNSAATRGLPYRPFTSAWISSTAGTQLGPADLGRAGGPATPGVVAGGGHFEGVAHEGDGPGAGVCGDELEPQPDRLAK